LADNKKGRMKNKRYNKQKFNKTKLDLEVEKKVKKIEKEWLKVEHKIESREMNQAPLFASGNVFCPICKEYFYESEYLRTAIDSPKTLWLANMVTHYRHTHISSWNKCWDGRAGNYYRSGWFGDYEKEKRLVNERAKRQIIRKCTDYLKMQKITVKDFEGLEYNDEKTIELAIKKL
jgi:hypothetical protein